MREETMGIILRGHPKDLSKALRMLKGMLDIEVVYSRRSEGKLWIHEERRRLRRFCRATRSESTTPLQRA